MKKKDFHQEKVPFFAWECITVVVNNREIDLVIRNEACMAAFLKILVYYMKTVDGEKNSALGIYAALKT